MFLLLLVLVSLAGGVGAVCRVLLDDLVEGLRGGALARGAGRGLPLGTIVVNVSGSLLLGLLVGMGASRALGEPWLSVAGAGFLGGYTTFSTTSWQTVTLLREGRWSLGLVNAVGSLALAALAAAVGLVLGGLT